MGKLLQNHPAVSPNSTESSTLPICDNSSKRIVLRCNLSSFQMQETVEYIHSRMNKAGMADQTVFPEELLREVHHRSQGIPRVINAICDNLLLTAFALEQRFCTLDMLDEVCGDMRLDWPGKRSKTRGGLVTGDPSAPPSFISPRE